VRWLLKKNLITGKVLDFGCGKCKVLNDTVLAKDDFVESVDSYDPHFSPIPLVKGTYDTILCSYVLNVVPVTEEKEILYRLQSLLLPHGYAYVSVRNDIVEEKGFQRKVVLPYLWEMKKTSYFRTYLLTPTSKLP